MMKNKSKLICLSLLDNISRRISVFCHKTLRCYKKAPCHLFWLFPQPGKEQSRYTKLQAAFNCRFYLLPETYCRIEISVIGCFLEGFQFFFCKFNIFKECFRRNFAKFSKNHREKLTFSQPTDLTRENR